MKQKSEIKVFFFGDSICFGQGVAIHKGWVTRISAQLEEIAQAHQREITVINASVNGNTTRLALERMPYDVQSHGPDLVLVQFGMNDCNYWSSDKGVPRVSPEGFTANLREILNRAFIFGAKTVLLSTNHPTLRDQGIFPHTQITYEASNRRYNALIRQVARSFRDRVVLVDVEKAFLREVEKGRHTLADLLLSDHLHLSPQGHDLYFSLVAPKVKKAVLELL